MILDPLLRQVMCPSVKVECRAVASGGGKGAIAPQSQQTIF